MEGLQDQLKRVTEKLQQVVQRYHLLQKEHEKEKARLLRIDELEMKMTALQSVTVQLNETEKREVEKRINRYIREIDRCIALLSE
jgi:ABC-type iron transport system FetAB ATPase subunit